MCGVQCFNLRVTKGLYFILFITQSDWVIWINLSHPNNTGPHWLSLYEHRNISSSFFSKNNNVVYTSLAKFCVKTLHKKRSIISIYSDVCNTTHTNVTFKASSFLLLKAANLQPNWTRYEICMGNQSPSRKLPECGFQFKWLDFGPRKFTEQQ